MPSKARRFSRNLAIAFGLFLAVAEVFYNWGSPSWWPFILVDYLAVALLLWAAFRAPRALPAAWGFTCAMFYMGFFANWQQGTTPWLLAGIGLLFALTVCGLVLSLIGTASRD